MQLAKPDPMVIGRTRERGFGIVSWVLMVPVVLAALLILTIAFFEGRKMYWDAQVKEMCEKDGRVTVFERTVISKSDADRIWGQATPLPSVDRGMDSPYFWERVEMVIRDESPKVVRAETLIKRRSDGKTLGRSVQFWRRGGDFPTGISEATHFMCPERATLSEQVFEIAGR